ncbi:hypothetical protein C0992_007986, partial [Termitomyces sp. T32_za158]
SARGITLLSASSKEICGDIALHSRRTISIFDILCFQGVPREQLEHKSKGRKSAVVAGKPLIPASRKRFKFTSAEDAKHHTFMTSASMKCFDTILKDSGARSLKDIVKSILKVPGKTEDELPGCLNHQDAAEQVYKRLPGLETIAVFSGTESGGRPALTFVFVGEEVLEGGSVPGAMDPLKSEIRGLIEAAATELGSYGVNVNSYFTRAVSTNMESSESTTALVDNLLGKNVDETAAGPAEMAEDVANVVSFLASKSARSISGTVPSLISSCNFLFMCMPFAQVMFSTSEALCSSRVGYRSNEIPFAPDYVPKLEVCIMFQNTS